jgi:hypothetical protein
LGTGVKCETGTGDKGQLTHGVQMQLGTGVKCKEVLALTANRSDIYKKQV